jgi:hypothetical protein
MIYDERDHFDTGQWQPRDSSTLNVTLPSCTRIETPHQYINGTLSYRNASCNDTDKIRREFETTLQQLNADFGFCSSSTCNFMDGMNVSCVAGANRPERDGNNRSKRQSGPSQQFMETSGLGVIVEFNYEFNSSNASMADVLQWQYRQSRQSAGDLNTQSPILNVNGRYLCNSPQKQLVKNNLEYNCGYCDRGTYWSGAMCTSCPLNTYQPQQNQTQCIPCPKEYPVTAIDGCIYVVQCIKYCPPGYQYDYTVRDCLPCPLGTYNPGGSASAKCLTCNTFYATRVTGCTNVSCCSETCPPGQEPVQPSTCVACKKGTYRSENETHCQKCDEFHTTSRENSTSPNDCSVVNCPPETHVNNPSSSFVRLTSARQPPQQAPVCVPCSTSEYSDNRNSSTCTKCTPLRRYFSKDTKPYGMQLDCDEHHCCIMTCWLAACPKNSRCRDLNTDYGGFMCECMQPNMVYNINTNECVPCDSYGCKGASCELKLGSEPNLESSLPFTLSVQCADVDPIGGCLIN